jgi:hypothetical protein
MKGRETHTMQTLISVFDDRGRARAAVDRLLHTGFGQSDIELRDGDEHGRFVLMVDARTETLADMAAVVLHEEGAIDVDDRDSSGGIPVQPGVRLYNRETRPALDDLARQRQLREESLLSDRAGQVSKELKEDREERAYAAAMTVTTRDRPK